jgi:hypothetical protein
VLNKQSAAVQILELRGEHPLPTWWCGSPVLLVLIDAGLFVLRVKKVYGTTNDTKALAGTGPRFDAGAMVAKRATRVY